jgi:hypothetical protein
MSKLGSSGLQAGEHVTRSIRRRDAKRFRSLLADPHGRTLAEQAVRAMAGKSGTIGLGQVNFGPTPWGRDDSDWFKANPRRSHRVRSPFDGETFDPSFGVRAGRPNLVAIRQIRQGLRVRRPITFRGCSADLVTTVRDLALRSFEEEGPAHLLCDLPGERLISPSEIAAMIATYEATTTAGRQ